MLLTVGTELRSHPTSLPISAPFRPWSFPLLTVSYYTHSPLHTPSHPFYKNLLVLICYLILHSLFRYLFPLFLSISLFRAFFLFKPIVVFISLLLGYFFSLLTVDSSIFIFLSFLFVILLISHLLSRLSVSTLCNSFLFILDYSVSFCLPFVV